MIIMLLLLLWPSLVVLVALVLLLVLVVLLVPLMLSLPVAPGLMLFLAGLRCHCCTRDII